jgi:Radical SAM superfamily
VTAIELRTAEHLKFRLLSSGLVIRQDAQEYIDERNGDRPMTPADYASTSGIIIAIGDDVWVNAPISLYNSNFVHDTPFELILTAEGLLVRGEGSESPAKMWLPPRYHGKKNKAGEEYTSYAFTHADRVRISPIEGCSMVCKFCNLPYEFRYRTKRVEGLVDAVRTALADPVQPASHVLISGGTPKPADVEYVRSVYEAVITGFPGVAVDIMMVPRDHLMDPIWLKELGVNELSVNLEIFDLEIGAELMRQKAKQGRQTYLDYLERATEVLGAGRVRSMLMVGLEPVESTLGGVEAIARTGAVPVLSPFRPDPATPLKDRRPSDADKLEEIYLRARDIAAGYGVSLGPGCIPCSHNTLTLASSGHGDAARHYGHPFMI